VSRKVTAMALRPVLVSQHTAPVVLGFRSARAFLEWLPQSGCRVITRGKDRLVALEDAEAALLRGQQSTECADTSTEPETSDAVLARLGRKRVAR
jgi:hypothetical protein